MQRKIQYLVNFPLHWITSLDLRPHEPINLLQKMGVILFHFSFRKSHKSSIFWGFFFWAFSPMIFHTFYKGFICGLCGGHFISASPSSSKKLKTVLPLWQGTLFCVNIGVSTVPLRKSIQMKKFFINKGINITVKTKNESYSHWRNHPPHHYAPPSNFTDF